ncbi:ABC transporter permease [Spirochaeta isovalerica]|uniref:Simple sugar transport system permease protein n=1 Tax=Spirochaeta isovalerica TaxID=150 RepID=A0A841RGS3_9SPIO|nr:ABC transporter permease [Spirochaeta isovalerica]MBB6481708.1 simple sugar transport system permease protein [Spirochaeta isovalerica]
MKKPDKKSVIYFLESNAVPILFLIIISIGVPYSGFSVDYLVQEIIIRLSRNSFLVLSLLVPIMAGMGLNFGMVLGAMAGQIGLIFVTNWNIVGLQGIGLAMILSVPLSILLGWMSGKILNMAKGREMVTGFILAFFMNGVYQLVVLYGMGSIIPIGNPSMVLSRGYGIRNTVNLINIRQTLDSLIPLKIGNIQIPVATFIVIALVCLFIVWFRKTKLGQDMRAIGQDMHVAESAGINVERTRIIAIIISTVLAGFGMILYLQNIGTLNTYNSHEQVGMFSIAALLVGGASVNKGKISHAFLGVTLFHLMFVISPMAGKNLIGQAQLGEYFRVFVSYGVISIALVLYAYRKLKEKERAGTALAEAQEEK